MSFGAGESGNLPRPTGMLASEANREAVQALLKQAYEEQRLTLEEFETRVGQAISARTLDQLADLTKDLPAAPVPPPTPPRRPRGMRLLIAAIGAVVAAGTLAIVIHSLIAKPGMAAAPAMSARKHVAPGPGGPAHCPVGTGTTALALANALARDPVYVDPASPPLTAAQADRLRAAIGSADPGRIRIAAVTPATVGKGGGERTLANAIASCPATSAGVTVVTTTTSTYLVTSYTNSKGASQAVGAALNTHTSLAAGLKDAVNRLAIIDKMSS